MSSPRVDPFARWSSPESGSDPFVRWSEPSTPTPAPTAPERPGFLRRTYELSPLTLPVGAAKGLLGSAYGATRLTNRALRALLPESIAPPAMPEELPPSLRPRGFGEQVGAFAEQAAEFLVPGGVVRRAVPAVAPYLGRAAFPVLEGLSAGTVGTVQTGSPEAGAAIGATAGTLTAVAPVVGRGLKGLGKQLMESRLKMPGKSYAEGATPETVFKYGLGGTLNQIVNKASEAIQTRAAALRDLLRTQEQTGTIARKVGRLDAERGRVALLRELDAAEAEALASPDSVNVRDAIRSAAQRWRQGLQEMGGDQGQFGILEANKFKHRIGLEGAWNYGRAAPDTDASEQLANRFYPRVRRAIEKAAEESGPEVAAINKELGELIPLHSAASRRVPIAGRQDLLPLIETVWAAGTGNVALPVAYWAGKSPLGATALYGTGRFLAGGPKSVKNPRIEPIETFRGPEETLAGPRMPTHRQALTSMMQGERGPRSRRLLPAGEQGGPIAETVQPSYVGPLPRQPRQIAPPGPTREVRVPKVAGIPSVPYREGGLQDVSPRSATPLPARGGMSAEVAKMRTEYEALARQMRNLETEMERTASGAAERRALESRSALDRWLEEQKGISADLWDSLPDAIRDRLRREFTRR